MCIRDRLIAVPLMDMTAIMIRRVKQGKSPFKPDRDHLHHICQRLGCSPTQTLILICSIAAILAGVGIIGEIFLIPEFLMFYGFIILFTVYLLILINYCAVINFFRRKLDLPEKKYSTSK